MKLVIGGAWDGAKRAIDSTVQHAKSASGKVVGGLKSGIGKLASVFMVVAKGAAVATAAIGAAFVAAKKLAENLDEVGKRADGLGVSAEFLQELEYAAQRSGVQVSALRQGFNQMLKLAGEARQGKQKAVQFFEWMGIDPASLGSMDAEQLFAAVAAGISNMGDQQKQAAVASRLFGDEFGKALAMLKDYKSLGNEARKKGLIISDEDIKAAAEFNDRMTELQLSFQALLVKTGLLQAFVRILTAINNVLTKLQNLDFSQLAIKFLDSLSVITSALKLKDTTKLVVEKKEEMQKQAAADKKQKEDLQKKEKEKKAAERKKRAEETAKADENLRKKRVGEAEDAALKKLEKQLQVQRMLNAGKEREVAIMQAVEAAEAEAARAGGTLSAAARARIEATAGALFDAKQKQTAQPGKAGDFSNAFVNWGVNGNLGGFGNVGGYATMGHGRYNHSVETEIKDIGATLDSMKDQQEKVYACIVQFADTNIGSVAR